MSTTEVDLVSFLLAFGGDFILCVCAIYLLTIGRVTGVDPLRDWRIPCACALFLGSLWWASYCLSN